MNEEMNRRWLLYTGKYMKPMMEMAIGLIFGKPKEAN